MQGSVGSDVCNGIAVLAGARMPGGRRRAKSSSGGDKSGLPAGSRKVLLIGRIRELALYRSEFLRAKGFSVVAPSNRAEVLDVIRRGSYDIVVLTYTLSSESVLEFAEMARQHCPECPVIIITDTGNTDRRVAPDEVVVADEGPEALLAALHRVVKPRLQ